MKFAIDHDLHCHSLLSECSSDPAMTVEALGRHAAACGYTMQCVTDHLWDSSVPGASGWYAPQDIPHVKQSLPLPEIDGVKMLFGCETELAIGNKLALAPEHFDEFDFIVIPPNHFHMIGLNRPAEVDTEEKVAEYYTRRLDELSRMELPWHKVGIAHLTCGLTFREGDNLKVLRLMDPDRLAETFRRFAANGAGIELNWGSIKGMGPEEHPDEVLKLYRIARDAGCRFYCASDAHHPAELDISPLRRVADLLELTEKERFVPAV